MNTLKIGARNLQENEVRAILLTYDNVYKQIEDIRSSVISDVNVTTEKDVDSVIQKTNNIAILGPRGSGKTSVLKTIRTELNNSSDANIVLPIIVPENMSTSSTLMATILGMFKNIVDGCKTSNGSKSTNCIRQENGELRQKYQEVVKQYTFIQKEYRSVLINEFTTENEYAKKSNEIFNSDTEFIRKFNDFINELIKHHKRESGESLIFFFIDDIDLSASRCTDVIKTLLSYISHQNIVTFISGDLETFEEALTIDFLRQEGALSSDVMTERYLESSKDNLLARKKDLAYEYLKKVVPPVYRHNIEKWHLEKRGLYCVGDTDRNLMNLLTELLDGTVPANYFRVKGKGEEKFDPMPYSYHLFDDTSRGLNNVYNVLLGISERLSKQEGLTFSDKKLLIETIIASKPMLNKRRDQLLGQIINFGKDEETTVVRLEALEGVLAEFVEAHIVEDLLNSKQVYLGIFGEIEAYYNCFLLVDLTLRLMAANATRNLLNSTHYKKLKNAAMAVLLQSPVVSGRYFNIESASFYLSPIGFDTTPKELMFNLLIKLDWDALMLFVNKLTMDLKAVYDENYEEKDSTILLHDIVQNFYDAIEEIAYLRGITPESYLKSIYDELIMEFAFIQNIIKSDKVNNIVTKLFSPILRKHMTPDTFDAWWNVDTGENSSQEERINQLRNLLLGTFTEWLSGDVIVDGSVLNLQSFDLLLSQDKVKMGKKIEDEKLRHEIIESINDKSLWQHELSENVMNYIEGEMKKQIEKMPKEVDITIKVDDFVGGSYKDFLEIYKGVSYTKAKETAAELRKVVCPDNYIKSEIDFAGYMILRKATSELAFNNRVSYGQTAAQKMLNQLGDLSLKMYKKDESLSIGGVFLNTSEYANKDKHKVPEEKNFRNLKRYMHYFLTAKAHTEDLDYLNTQSDRLSKFRSILSDSQSQFEESVVFDFLEAVNAEKEVTTMDNYYRLFG